MLVAPLPADEAREVELVKGPNIASLPDFEPLPDELELPVLLKMGDDISTDEILRAGTEVLPFRSNIPEIADFAFDVVDETYPARAPGGPRRRRHASSAAPTTGRAARASTPPSPRATSAAGRDARQGVRAHPLAEPRQLRGRAAASSPTRSRPTFGFLERMGRLGELGARHDLPYHIVGSDAAAVVLRVGPGVTKWQPGDRVTVHCNYVDLEGSGGPRGLDAGRGPEDLGV
jgi:hypothetical protein